MSYTNPNGQPQGKPTNFINILREAAIAELLAINNYDSHIANSNMPEVNKAWYDIIKEEKQHYGWFLNLIRKYDPVEYKEYIKHLNLKIQKTPFQRYIPNYEKTLILNNIRDDIKGELEAIILYEEQVKKMPYKDIIDVFYKVINDEKEHVEHLTKLLITYDSDKYIK